MTVGRAALGAEEVDCNFTLENARLAHTIEKGAPLVLNLIFKAILHPEHIASVVGRGGVQRPVVASALIRPEHRDAGIRSQTSRIVIAAHEHELAARLVERGDFVRQQPSAAVLLDERIEQLFKLGNALLTVLLLDGEDHGLVRVRLQKGIALLEHTLSRELRRPGQRAVAAEGKAVHQHERPVVHAETDIQIAVARLQLLGNAEILAFGKEAELNITGRAVVRTGKHNSVQREISVQICHPIRRPVQFCAVDLVGKRDNIEHGGSQQNQGEYDRYGDQRIHPPASAFFLGFHFDVLHGARPP